MKKFFTTLMIAICCIFGCLAPAKTVRAEAAGENLVILFTQQFTETEIVITATLRENTGVYAMNLQLDYNIEALTFTGFERGAVLPKLDLITTNTETEEGFNITPFRFNWLNKTSTGNDNSVGELIVLHFTVKETAKDGDYKIGFTYERGKDIGYLDKNGNLQTKNALISSTVLKLEGDKIVSAEVVENGDVKSDEDVGLVVLAIVTPTLVATVSVVLIVRAIRGKKSKPKGWKKIDE